MEGQSAVGCPLVLPGQVDGSQKGIGCYTSPSGSTGDHGFCAICLDRIALQETALIKGCEHAYCITCILRWASYNQKPSCPQCKHPFESLSIHRSLDGCIHDYMFEESVCLLLRATWFVPLKVDVREDEYEEQDDIFSYYYEDDDDDELEDAYYMRSSSTLRIGNRRWGDNGYVRAGRKEARPVNRQFMENSDAGTSRPLKKEAPKDPTGRRAKRAMKREAADKAAAAKHQQHLERLGRK